MSNLSELIDRARYCRDHGNFDELHGELLDMIELLENDRQHMTTDPYGKVRRDEYSTLGDAYRMCRQDPEAFAAGAQYALDRLTSEHSNLMLAPHQREFLLITAAETLTRALAGEPQ